MGKKSRVRPFVPRGYCIIGFDEKNDRYLGLAYSNGTWSINDKYVRVFTTPQRINSFRYPDNFKKNKELWDRLKRTKITYTYDIWYDKHNNIRKCKIKSENHRTWLAAKDGLEFIRSKNFHLEFNWHIYRIGSKKCPVRVFTREARNIILGSNYDEFMINNYGFVTK